MCLQVFKYFIATTYKFEITVLGTAIQNLPLFNDFICIKTKEASQGQRIDIFMKLHKEELLSENFVMHTNRLVCYF